MTTDVRKEDESRKQELVVANHILAHQGVVDGFGHISVRSAENPDRYFLARDRAPALVEIEDIMEFDLDSNPIAHRGEAMYNERYIHGELYRKRKDVNSVVHSHSESVIPFGVTGVPIRPLFHMAGFLRGQCKVFEIRDVEGENNQMLVRNPKSGAALAELLGDDSVILMRGHGDVVVGKSIKQAVYRAIYTEINAQLQASALQMGDIVYLNEFEARNMDEAFDRGIDRPWDVWVRNSRATKI